MKNPEPFDKIISQAVKENTDDAIDVPDMTDVWENIENHVKSKKKSNKGLIGGAVAAILIIASANVFLLNDGYASYFRTLKMFLSEKDNVTNIQMDNKTPGEKTNLEGDIPSSNIVNHDNGFTEYIVPLDMARDISSFLIVEPSYIPPGFEIGKVSLMEFNDMTYSATLKFTYYEGKSIEITLVPMLGESVLSININPSTGSFREEFIGGYRYYVIEYKSGYNEIIWNVDEIEYNLRANISIEESLKVASSFRG